MTTTPELDPDQALDADLAAAALTEVPDDVILGAPLPAPEFDPQADR